MEEEKVPGSRERNEAIESLLVSSGVFELRKPATVRDRYVEVDVWARQEDLMHLDQLLAPEGFVPVDGDPGSNHRFYLRHTEDGWEKVDAKLVGIEGRRPSIRRRLARNGMVVAILGADGAGKTTLIEALVHAQPYRVESVYLGWRSRQPSTGSSPAPARRAPLFRQILGLLLWTARTTRRLWSISWRTRRGWVVLCDRHPIEVESGRPRDWMRRTKRLVTRVLPRPDLLVMLDAPAEVLYARKGEHDVDVLTRMATDYRDLVRREGGVIVDATKPSSQVAARVEKELWIQLTRGR